MLPLSTLMKPPLEPSLKSWAVVTEFDVPTSSSIPPLRIVETAVFILVTALTCTVPARTVNPPVAVLGPLSNRVPPPILRERTRT